MEWGDDDLFSLKANRPAMVAEMEALFAAPSALTWHETIDAHHGRIEPQRHATSQDTDSLFSDRRYAGEPAMPGLATVAVLNSTLARHGQTSLSRRHHVFSARLTPERFVAAMRARWSIEKSQHWVGHDCRWGPCSQS